MKIALIIILILLCNRSFSQNESPLTKGNITLGGEVYINYNKEKNESSDFSYMNYEHEYLRVGLNPQVGYFVVDQLVVGLSIPLSYLKSYAYGDFLASSYFSIGVAPYAKYYFAHKFFTQLSAGYEFGENKFENSDTKETINGFTIVPTIGYAFFIHSNISLEPSISYAYSKKNTNFNYRSRYESGYYDYGYNYDDTSIDKNEYKTEDRSFIFSIGFHLFL